MSVTYEFVNPGGNLTLDESQLVDHNPYLTHTGKGDLRATFEETRELDDYAQRQDRLNVKFNGVTKWTGYLVGVNHNEWSGTTTIRADGIAKRLEETRPDYESIGGPVSYTNIALHDAIRDYWSRTEFSNFTVTDQSTETVATDSEIQSADTTTEWSNITTIADTDPIAIQNDNLEQVQTCFTTEGEDYTTNNNGGLYKTYPELSGGAGWGFDGVNGIGDYIEWEFTTDHVIPESDVSVQVREWTNANDCVGFTWYLDGNELDGLPEGQTNLVLNWADYATGPYGGPGWTGGDLSSGTHTLRVEVDGASSGQDYIVDVVAPNDSRYSYTFDNDNGGSSGYLDGPELYPIYPFELDSITVEYNVDSATATTTWNDTSNNQAIALSNDDGSTYDSASNTDTHTVNFTNAGRIIQTKFTFSRYGTRTDATPLNGFNGQVVNDYALTADLNDLVVIDSLYLSRNHFDNMQTLHNYGNFLWVIEHDDVSLGNLVVSSFQEFDETRSSPSEWDNPENKNPGVKAEFYFNSVYLEGAKDANGNRPTAEVSDTDAINNDGREIQAILRDLDITTEAGAGFRAQSILQTALSNNDLVGTVTSPPNMIDPGFAREVDFGNGLKYKTVEEVSLSQSNDELVATYDFTIREDFAEELSKLKRQARDIGDQV